jgi:heptosyltransferase II
MSSRILIIGPSWVGDTIMAQALFKLLKAQYPALIIDVLAPLWTFSLLERMPEVNQSIPLPITHGELKLRERYRIARTLRQNHYDQAIILPNSFKSALIPFLAKIPKRTGWAREGRSILLTDARKLDKKQYPRMMEQYLALGLPPNATLPTQTFHPEFAIKAANQETALAKHQPTWRGKPVLALCAGAEFGPTKRWPADYYAAVAHQKIQEGWDVWLFGSPKDLPVTETIMQLTNGQCSHLTGRLELAETIDLLSLVSGVVSNDSGLMHAAAALKKPLIAIYGSTSPAFTPPLAKNAIILQQQLSCQPCFERECPLTHYRCLRDIKPEQVLSLMSSWGEASAHTAN